MSVRRRPPPRVAAAVSPLSAAGSLHGPAIGFKPGYALPTDGLVTLTPGEAEGLEEEAITGPEFVPGIPTTLEEWKEQWYSHVVWQDAERPQIHYFARNVWRWMISQQDRTPRSPLRDAYTEEEYRVLKAIFYDRSTLEEKNKVRAFELRTGWSGPQRDPGADAPDAVPYGIPVSPASPVPRRPSDETPPTPDAPRRPRRPEDYVVRGQVYLWSDPEDGLRAAAAEVYKRTMIRNLVSIRGIDEDLLQDLSVVVSGRMDGLRHASSGLQDDPPVESMYRRVVFTLHTTEPAAQRLANYFNNPRTGVSTAPPWSYAAGWVVLLGLSDVDEVVRGLTRNVRRVVINEALHDPNGDGSLVGINNPRGYHFW